MVQCTTAQCSSTIPAGFAASTTSCSWPRATCRSPLPPPLSTGSNLAHPGLVEIFAASTVVTRRGLPSAPFDSGLLIVCLHSLSSTCARALQDGSCWYNEVGKHGRAFDTPLGRVRFSPPVHPPLLIDDACSCYHYRFFTAVSSLPFLGFITAFSPQCMFSQRFLSPLFTSGCALILRGHWPGWVLDL